MAKRTLTASSFSMTLVRHTPNAVHALVAGDLDIASVPAFESTLLACVESDTQHLAVDLNGATMVDSTGLTSLLRLHRALQERGGTFQVVCVNPRIVKLFTITGLVRVLSIVAINPLDDTPLAS